MSNDPKTETVGAPLQYAVGSGSRGYDDVAYVGSKVYLSYTNPVGTGDAVIQQLTVGQNPQTPLTLPTILADGATGTNIATGQTGQVIPLSDPDFLKSLSDGRLVLTSGSDNTFAIVTNPGQVNQSVRYDTLTNLPAGSSLDDVIVPNAHAGTFYLSNAGTNQIEKISVTGLAANHAYASVGTELVDVNLRTGAQTSGDNAALIFVHNPGLASQTDSFLTLPAGSSGLDDAVMPTTSSGTFIVTNTAANDVLRLTVNGLNTHDLYGSLGSSNAIVQIDPTTGVITRIVTGLSSPHGLAFLPSAAPSASASLTVHIDAATASIGAAYAALVTPSSGESAGGVSASPQVGGLSITHESPLTMPPLTGHASHA